MPPLQLVLNVAWHGVALPVIVVCGVAYVCARYLGKPGQVAGGLLAISLGFLAGNYFLEPVEFRLDPERPFSIVELGRAMWLTVSGSVPENESVPSSRYWLPWCSLLAALVGLLFRVPKMHVAVAWAIRIVTAVFLSRLLVGPELRVEIVWLWPVIAVVLLAGWYMLDVLGNEPTSNWLPGGMIWFSFASATVLIHAHTARFTDLSTILAGCWAGLTIAARLRPNVPLRTSALPLVAIGLPGVMLIAQQSTFSEVPTLSFVLMGLAPLLLSPLLFIRGWRKTMPSYQVAAWALMIAPALLAVILAARAETLSFE